MPRLYFLIIIFFCQTYVRSLLEQFHFSRRDVMFLLQLRVVCSKASIWWVLNRIHVWSINDAFSQASASAYTYIHIYIYRRVREVSPIKQAQWQKRRRDQSGLTNVIPRYSVVVCDEPVKRWSRIKSLEHTREEMVPEIALTGRAVERSL